MTEWTILLKNTKRYEISYYFFSAENTVSDFRFQFESSPRRRLVPGHPPPAGELVERVAGVPVRVDRSEDPAAQLGALRGHANLLGADHGSPGGGGVARGGGV